MAAGKTRLLTVNDATPTELLATIVSQIITIVEDGEAPTTSYILKKPTGTAQGITRPTGSLYTFNKGFGRTYGVGESLGTLQTVAGTVDFAIDEQGL